MSSPTAYMTLISSLPRHGGLSSARRPPISRLRLERRLRMLTPENARLLARIEDILQWDRLRPMAGDAAVLRAAKRLLADLHSPFLRGIVLHRMEVRTVVAALRRRHRGEAAPRRGDDWGFGRWMARINANWDEPGLGLETGFPWIREAERMLAEGDSLGLERLLLGAVWGRLGREGADHHFDFEAVVVYVLRWNVIHRWTRRDGGLAAERFGELLDAALGEHRRLFVEEVPNGA